MLRNVEAKSSLSDGVTSCLHQVILTDLYGNKTTVQLLHCGIFLKLLEGGSIEDSKLQFSTLDRALAAQPTCSPASPNGSAVLYVKDAVDIAKAEIECRQQRFLAKMKGRLLAKDMASVDLFIKEKFMNDGVVQDDVAAGMYHGIVEALAGQDFPAALALALNSSLPPLSAGATAALVRQVELTSCAAVETFLESFAERDGNNISCDSCATEVAVQLRSFIAVNETAEGKKTAVTTARVLLQKCLDFNVDPSTVFPSDPAAIQLWASRLLSAAMLPVQRSQTVLNTVKQCRLLPRRTAMDALSVWTLSDLERPWLCFALRRSLSPSGTDTVFYSTAYQLALKDPRRNLIDNRLLSVYAAALERGDISALDASFSSFMDECGECHEMKSSERPLHLRFAIPKPPAMVTLRDALRDLAPKSSYWCTLLQHFPELVRVYTAPMQELRVEIELPQMHECIPAAAAMPTPPVIPVLFEDDAILVLDKPAGLATSRHALSSTQLGNPITDLISLLLLRGSPPPLSDASGANVFRQGQVHRLDTETSGCILFAKTQVAADSLRHQMGTSGAFSQRSKVYLALCLVVEPSLDDVKLCDEIKDARDAKIQTRYRVIRFFHQHRIALVECRIQQGKKHQIRRHLSSRGLPILGDLEHGGAACCQTMISRVALHAHSLTFIHPTTADPMTILAPIPPDFQRCISLLSGGCEVPEEDQ